VPTRIRWKQNTSKLNITLKSQKAQLTFSEKFKVECIEGSAISESVYHAAIDFIEDTGRWECHEALNLEVRREWKTRKPHNFDTLAVFRNEDETIWHSKAKNPVIDFDGRERRYQAPLGNGSRLFMPALTVGDWVLIAQKNGLEEFLPEWVRKAHENGHDKLRSGTRESEIFATTLKTEHANALLKESLLKAEDGWILDSSPTQDLGKAASSQSYLKPSDFSERGIPETKSFSASGMDWDTESESVLIRNTSDPSEVLSTLECTSFWDWVRQTNCPLILAEGGKKSMALLSIGYAAVAVYGVNAGYGVRIDGTECPPFLIPDLQTFAATPRKFTIAFDQDESAKTRRKVSRATIKMGLLLETAGSKVQIAEWDSTLGKGIDDVAVSSGAAMIDRILNDTSVIKDAEKAERLARAKLMFSCTRTPDVVLNDKYLDITKLPGLQPGEMMAVSSVVGSGKTEILAAGIRKHLEKYPDTWVVSLGYLNALLLQSADRLEIDHIWQIERDYPGSLTYGIGMARGVGMCLDSMLKIDWDKMPENTLLVLDEAEAIMAHALEGGTMGDRHNEILELFQSVTTRCLATGGNIILLEDSLTDLSLNFYEELTGVSPLFVRNDWTTPKTADFQTGNELGWTEDRLKELESGMNIMLVSTSQKYVETFDYFARQRFPNIETMRMDSTTSDLIEVKYFQKDPNKALTENNYQAAFLSPSAQSGLNVTVEGWHLRAHFNNGDTRGHFQQLGRLRNPESIKIFCKPVGMRLGRSTSPDQILKQSRILKQHTARLTGLRAELEGDEAAIARLNETLSDSDKKELFWAKHAANLEARRNLSERDMADNLREYLTDRGWTINDVEGNKSTAIKKGWKEARRAIEKSKAAHLARLPGGQGAETAKRILSSGSAKYEERVNAQKSMLMLNLPGAPLSEKFLLDLVISDRGRGLKAVTLAFMCHHPEIANKVDKANFRSQLNKPFLLRSRLTHYVQKVDLYKQSGVEAIKTASDAGEKIHENHPLVVASKMFFLDNAASIHRVFGLHMNDEQTGMHMFSKFGRKFGLALECTGQIGGRNERRVRIYKVISNIDECHLEEAFDALERKWRADLEPVHTISSNTNPYIKMTCTEPEPPPIEESPPPLAQGQQVKFCLDQSICVVQRVESGGAILKRVDNPIQTQTFFAKLGDLRAS
jgi:Domain of unknown function (DUF3854)